MATTSKASNKASKRLVEASVVLRTSERNSKKSNFYKKICFFSKFFNTKIIDLKLFYNINN